MSRLGRFSVEGEGFEDEARVTDRDVVAPPSYHEGYFWNHLVRFCDGVRRSLGQAPRLKIRRSFAVDETLYRVFDHHGRQYVAVVSLTPRQRLRGKGRTSGSSGTRPVRPPLSMCPTT